MVAATNHYGVVSGIDHCHSPLLWAMGVALAP
jgi:hypothetical protein